MRVETTSSEAPAKGKGGKKTGAASNGRKKTPEEAEQILRAEVRPGDIVLFKSSNGAKLGILGDQVAFAEYTFGAEEEQAPTWLSAGDFVETTDLSDHLAAHLDGAAKGDRTSTEQTTNEG